MFPFTVTLPENIPNSFKTKFVNNEVYSIRYTIRAYFESDEPILSYSHPITVNQIPKI